MKNRPPRSRPEYLCRGTLTPKAKHFAVWVAGLRKIPLAKLATLRVTLRVSNF
jgi:hypothetical protein